MTRSITFDMILKNTGHGSYILETKEGRPFHEFSASCDTFAMEQAINFMSSWSSVNISWEIKDEVQDEQ